MMNYFIRLLFGVCQSVFYILAVDKSWKPFCSPGTSHCSKIADGHIGEPSRSSWNDDGSFSAEKSSHYVIAKFPGHVLIWHVIVHNTFKS